MPYKIRGLPTTQRDATNHSQQITMNKFRVFVKDKFDVVFDTIEKARECRRALHQIKYTGIEIIITQEDIDPR